MNRSIISNPGLFTNLVLLSVHTWQNFVSIRMKLNKAEGGGGAALENSCLRHVGDLPCLSFHNLLKTSKTS